MCIISNTTRFTILLSYKKSSSSRLKWFNQLLFFSSNNRILILFIISHIVPYTWLQLFQSLQNKICWVLACTHLKQEARLFVLFVLFNVFCMVSQKKTWTWSKVIFQLPSKSWKEKNFGLCANQRLFGISKHNICTQNFHLTNARLKIYMTKR